jgi:hypothetical protein
METLARPSIKTTDLLNRADRFSERLVEDLLDINKSYPHAVQLSDGEQRLLENVPRTSSGELPGPTPDSSRLIFKAIFCAYMAEQFILEPNS